MSRSLFDRIIRRIDESDTLGPAEQDALHALPYRQAVFEPQAYLVREGQRPQNVHILLSGFAYRQKTLIDGVRQIIGVALPCDFLDLEAVLLDRADHNIQALTRCEVAVIPGAALKAVSGTHPAVACALWRSTMVEGAQLREWITNVGRRDARARLAHLLCEFARRLERAGLGSTQAFDLPMTQEQLADALGLTPVHVNRVLKQLEVDGLITRERRFIRIPHWEALSRVAGFNDHYLHCPADAEQGPVLNRC